MTKPSAKDWRNRPVADWNTTTFTVYLTDRHREVYGTEYTPPGRNWAAERGLIGSLIGTAGKKPRPRKYEPEVVREFIDQCFASHRCTPQWPTVSFTWLYKWKTDIWARVVAEHARKAQVAAKASAPVDYEELADWL
jgi:hypothetical protein